MVWNWSFFLVWFLFVSLNIEFKCSQWTQVTLWVMSNILIISFSFIDFIVKNRTCLVIVCKSSDQTILQSTVYLDLALWSYVVYLCIRSINNVWFTKIKLTLPSHVILRGYWYTLPWMHLFSCVTGIIIFSCLLCVAASGYDFLTYKKLLKKYI